MNKDKYYLTDTDGNIIVSYINKNDMIEQLKDYQSDDPSFIYDLRLNNELIITGAAKELINYLES
jgi:hypothetical protein